jgi:ribokinase
MNNPPKYDVIVCGSLHLDIIVSAPALPRIDETAVGSKWQQICGGKGGNQSVQSARAGARTAMIGCVGQDDFGKTLLANLKAANVDTSAISIDAVAGSGMSVAILQESGDYGAVIVSGSNLNIDPDALIQTWAELGGAKILVLQNEVPHSVNVAAAKAARNHHAKVVFNAAPARALTPDLGELIDVLIVNQVEAEMISGLPVHSRQSAMNSLPMLGGDKRAVIITLGGNGIVMQDSGGLVVEISARPVTVTSTHGAGDCFIGVLSSEISKGSSLELACRMANDKAATYVSRKLE